MASGIPKRAMNAKKKEKRARNKAKNEKLKPERIAAQQAREVANKKLGSTGKQRANQAAKEKKAPVEMEDLLES
jgi:hypothetical protein